MQSTQIYDDFNWSALRLQGRQVHQTSLAFNEVVMQRMLIMAGTRFSVILDGVVYVPAKKAYREQVQHNPNLTVKVACANPPMRVAHVLPQNSHVSRSCSYGIESNDLLLLIGLFSLNLFSLEYS